MVSLNFNHYDWYDHFDFANLKMINKNVSSSTKHGSVESKKDEISIIILSVVPILLFYTIFMVVLFFEILSEQSHMNFLSLVFL